VKPGARNLSGHQHPLFSHPVLGALTRLHGILVRCSVQHSDVLLAWKLSGCLGSFLRNSLLRRRLRRDSRHIGHLLPVFQ
jgi:hypothetical protein